MELQLEDLEADAAEDDAVAEVAAAKTATVTAFERKRPVRKPFPEHLPRERVVVPAPCSCPACGGNGFEHIEMQFLSDVYLRCVECSGSRYRAETLEIKFEGADGHRASIADVLAMTVTEALAFFKAQPEVAARLQPLSDVGLDYLKLERK